MRHRPPTVLAQQIVGRRVRSRASCRSAFNPSGLILVRIPRAAARVRRRMRSQPRPTRSRTRGRTATGPMPVMISRSGRCPWRTNRWPSSSVSLSACTLSKAATSGLCHAINTNEVFDTHSQSKRELFLWWSLIDVGPFPRAAQAALANPSWTDFSKASSFCTLGRCVMRSKCAAQCLKFDRSSSNCRARR